jgi:hypothetical protein
MPLDIFDNSDFYCSEYDLLRIEDLEIGGKVESESGDFTVFKYKDSYLVFLKNDQRLQKVKKEMLEFKTLKEVIRFLKSQ